MSADLPACNNRGRVGAVKVHCRHPQITGPNRRSRAVSKARCMMCTLHDDPEFERPEPPSAANPPILSFPCVHRAAEPHTTTACKPCRNNGHRELPVYKCAIHGECIIRGIGTTVTRTCAHCSDRVSGD